MAAAAELVQGERRGVNASETAVSAERGGGARLVLGWEEWVSLPALGVHAIKAKIDTGARTSALHAEAIELVSGAPQPLVRFTIRPAPRRLDIVVACEALLLDKRTIVSSNGIAEVRYVIATDLTIAGRCWPIELSLSDRSEMSYRMLLGRQALQAGGVLVDPAATRLQPRLGFSAYPGFKRKRRTAKT